MQLDLSHELADLKSRFSVMDSAMSAKQATSTNSGLIFTPSVSSSKKRKSPALEAGSGFFFLLLMFSYPAEFDRPADFLKYVVASP